MRDADVNRAAKISHRAPGRPRLTCTPRERMLLQEMQVLLERGLLLYAEKYDALAADIDALAADIVELKKMGGHVRASGLILPP